MEKLKSIGKSNRSIFVGAGAVMLAALFWSLDGVFIRPKFYTSPAGLVVFLEHALGFIVLAPFIILGWSKIKALRKKDWLAVLWVCIFGGLLGTLMITKAFFAAVNSEVTFATVVILQKLQPFFALLLARIVLNEKLSKKFYFWAAIAILASYFLAFGKTGLSLGDIDWLHNAAFFALIAAFAFGSSTVFGKRIVNHLDFKSTAALRFGITTLLTLIYVLFSKDLFGIGDITGLQWKYLIIIVFTSGAVAMFLYYFGLKRITASTATICELFWPFSAVILDYFMNKNVLNATQILAAVVIFTSFYMVTKKGQIKNIKFSARVIDGEGRGAKLGFPTINLDGVDLNINHGIYITEAEIKGNKHQALLHFGPKETFAKGPSMELLLKEKIEDVAGSTVKVKIVKKIREVKKFKDQEELKQAIKNDLSNI